MALFFQRMKKKDNVEQDMYFNNTINEDKLNSLYSIRYSAMYLGERTGDLVNEELKTSTGISNINELFVDLRNKSEEIDDSIITFYKQFNNIKNVIEVFKDNVTEISRTVDGAQNKVSDLKQKSYDVDNRFDDIESKFDDYSVACDMITGYVKNIIEIAKEANALAYNTSQKAMKMCNNPNEFSKTCDETKRIAERIDKLIDITEINVGQAGKKSETLSSTIRESRNSLNESYSKANDTEFIFEEIKEKLDEAAITNEEIVNIVDDSNKEIFSISRAVEESKVHYKNVAENIRDLNEQLSNKSVIFEDLNNFLVQIPPIIKDFK